MSGREQATEFDHTLTKRPGETQTAFAVRCVQAQAWDEGALWAAVECGAIADESVPWLAPGDNPYRTPHADSP